MRFFSLRNTARAVVATLGLSVVALVSGCQQGIGQRCQTQGDCDSGLICVIPPGMSPQDKLSLKVPVSGDSRMGIASSFIIFLGAGCATIAVAAT